MYPVNIAYHYLSCKIFSPYRILKGKENKEIATFKNSLTRFKSQWQTPIAIRDYRKHLNLSRQMVQLDGLGAGRHGKTCYKRRINEIYRTSSISNNQGRWLYFLCSFFKTDIHIELGSCLGISTMYLALAAKEKMVYTVEGEALLWQEAVKGFKQYGLDNIEATQAQFDDFLVKVTPLLTARTFVFIDGNHRYEETLTYVNFFLTNTKGPVMLVIDDIRWSKGMYTAWKKIIDDSRVQVAIDLFQAGVIMAY